jgi:glutaredoxin 3
MLKEFLSQRGVTYTERDVTVDRTAAGELMRLTGQMAVPVTVVDGQTVVGFDRPKLEHLLATVAHGPSLGAAVGDAAKITSMRGLPLSEGAFVGGVRPGFAAQRLGLVIGDIIIEVNGQPVRSANDLERMVSGFRPGGRILLVFLREGNRRAAEGTF